MTVTDAVSLHPDVLVQMNLYMPGVLNVVILVVGFKALVIVALPGLFMAAVHVPVPVPAIAALPPGSTAQFTV